MPLAHLKKRFGQLAGSLVFNSVVGPIDGYHIWIKPPNQHKIDYFNYKGFFSINIQAICDPSGKLPDMKNSSFWQGPTVSSWWLHPPGWWWISVWTDQSHSSHLTESLLMDRSKPALITTMQLKHAASLKDHLEWWRWDGDLPYSRYWRLNPYLQ